MKVLQKPNNQLLIFIIIMVFLVLVFCFDYFTPPEYDAWVLYVLPLFLSFLLNKKGAAYLVASLITLLIIVGIYVDYSISISKVFILNVIWFNRTVGILSGWILAIGIEYFKYMSTVLEDARRLADIGVISAKIAHEIRNPLAAIQLAAHNIRRKNTNSELDPHLCNIEKKIAEGDHIIQNLLSYSKIKKAEFEKIIICAILKDAVMAIKNKYNGTAILFEEKYSIDDSVIIEANPIQMQMLFSNLLDNACQALKDGVGTISLAAVTVGQAVTVSIQDDGIGIDEQAMAKIFEPFYTTKSRGTGLGLAVCREIVEMHRGTIVVQSIVGKGTTFIVTLPARNQKNFLEAE
jgi:signal transduction histidine kinase